MKEILTSSVVEGSAYLVPSYKKLEEREREREHIVDELKSLRIYKYKYISKDDDTYLLAKIEHMDAQALE